MGQVDNVVEATVIEPAQTEKQANGHTNGGNGKPYKFASAAAEKFYSLYREQYNPELIIPDSAVEEWIAVGTFRAKEKENASVKPQTVYDWIFAEKTKR